MMMAQDYLVIYKLKTKSKVLVNNWPLWMKQVVMIAASVVFAQNVHLLFSVVVTFMSKLMTNTS